MSVFSGGGPRDQKKTAKRTRKRPAAEPKPPAKPAAKPSILPAGPITLSPTAQALYDEIASQWELTPPVRALLRIVAEAMTKAEVLEQITAAEGMTIPDAKGAAKVHPAALLARDYRAQASNGLQRILSNIEG